VAFVVGSLLPILPGFVAYVVLWLVVPTEATTRPATRSETSSRPGRAASRASAGR